MKNFFKITSLILLVLFAASCSNGLLSTAYNSQTNDNGKCLVSFSITNFASNSRTILPTKLEIENIDHFTIEGKSNKGEVLTETEVDIDETTKEGKVTLSYSLWKLTLKAYDANNKLLLQGTSTPDLTNGAAAILFTLTEKGVGTKGSVKLSGNFEDQDNLIDTVVCGVYNIITGIAVDEKETTGVTDKKFSYEKTDLLPGEYVFKVILKKGTEEYAVWSDVVKVAPGIETSKDDILITQDLIGTKPTQPDNLMAYLIDNSENDDGTYKVKLTWEDKSLNESKFVVTLKEYSAVGTEDAVTPKTFDILASTETTTLELKLGKLYDISIAAVNRINKDNFEDDKIERVAATGNADDPDDPSYTTEAITSTRINRFKIEYMLDGGKYIKSATESQIGGVLVDYHTYSETTPVPLKTINEYNETTPVYPTLIKGNFPFVKWIAANDTTSTEVTSYDGFTNYSVKAVYNQDCVINVEIPGYKTLDPSRILCTYGKTTDDTQTTCYDGRTTPPTSTEIDGKTEQVLTLTIAEATADQPVFDEYKILIQGNIVYTGSSNVAKAFTNTKDYDAGTYILTACAKDSETGIWYSYTFGFTIAR